MNVAKLKLSVTNCYLIKVKDSYLLIDTGYDWEWKAFCSKLQDLNISFADISHIILTHHHDDHSGLLNMVLSKNPGIKAVMSHRAKNLLSKGKNDRSHGGAYINKRVNTLLTLKRMFDKRWTQTFPAFVPRKEDIMIEGDVSLQEIGIALNGKILETPGHSVDSISVLFDDGDCFAGDAAANFLQFAGTKYCIIYLEDIEEYYRTWRKMINAGAKRIHPAHGGSFGVSKLDKNINANRKSNMAMIS